MANKGSWFGLPDFGVTERISDALGFQRTAQGGSDLKYSPKTPMLSTPRAAAPSYSPVLGKSTSSAPTNTTRSVAPTSTPTQSAPTPTDAGQGLEDAAYDQRDAELQALLSEYDYNREQLQNQASSADTQKNQTLSYLEEVWNNLKGEIGTQKERAGVAQEREIGEASDTAQSVTRKNRNILRGLGILNSSAAGELLSQPNLEFGKQRAGIVEDTRMRMQDLDNFFNNKMSEHKNAVDTVMQQYTDLTSKIASDLRFNDRQRADAIQSANAALSQRIAEIKASVVDWQMRIDAAKTNLTSSTASLQDYADPAANLSAIQNTMINPSQQTQTQSVGVAEDKDRNLLSTLFGF